MGRTSTSGQGRPLGSKNKFTKALKTTVLSALETLGGEQYLVEQGKANPAAFMSLLGRILPTEVKAELTGKDGAPLAPAVYIGQALAIMLAGTDNRPQISTTSSLPRSESEAERLTVDDCDRPPV